MPSTLSRNPKKKKKFKLTPEALLLREAERGRHDLFYFAKYILGYNLLDESVHQEVCNILSFRHKTFTSKKKLVLLPRDTFKSTIGTVALPLHLLTRAPNLSILIDCEVFSSAKAFLSEIKARVEEESFTSRYGNWCPSRSDDHRWTESLVDILPRSRRVKEGSIACSGVDKSITGQHYDVVICDDLVGETNYATQEQLEKVVRHFTLVSESILKKDGVLIVIGTRWNDVDVYGHVLDLNKSSGDWDVIVRPAVTYADNVTKAEWPPSPTSKYFFPKRLDEVTLNKKWVNMDDELFFSQYLLDPTPPGSSAFNAQWFSFFNTLPSGDKEPLNFHITCDPSTATKYGDFSAIAVVAVDKYQRWYLVEMIRDKLDPSQIMDTLFSLTERYHPVSVGIETVAFQQTLVHFLNREQISRNKFIPIIELRTSTQVTKEQRIRSLIPYFKQGRIFFPNPPTPAVEQLIIELKRFPKSRHDDCADALAYMPQLVLPPEMDIPPPVNKPFHEDMWDRIMGREKAVNPRKGDPAWMS